MDDERDRERRDELPEHETRPEGGVEAPSSGDPLPGEVPEDEEPAIDPDAPPPAYRFR